MHRLLSLILAPFILLCTAMPPESIPPDYLITEITVTDPDHPNAFLQFSDQATMGQLLTYLRTVSLKGKADKDSMDLALPIYTIRLVHATGRITQYRQLGTEYLSKNDSPWYQIDPTEGRFLIAFFPNSLYNE